MMINYKYSNNFLNNYKIYFNLYNNIQNYNNNNNINFYYSININHLKINNNNKFNNNKNIKKNLKKFLFISSHLTFILLNSFFLKINNPNKTKNSNNFLFFQNLFLKSYNFYKYIHNTLTLPYNSFLLLDKLQPEINFPQKTLVLNLNKTLLCYSYSLLNGFEILLRPGLKKFLNELNNIYEIILFCEEDQNFLEEICNKLDPKKEIFKYKLGKESIKYIKGKGIKDIYYLNRNLNNIICVDNNINAINNKDNVVLMPEFNGNGKDRELLMSIVFFKEIGKKDVIDVRNEIKKYGNYRTYINFYKSNIKYKNLIPNNIKI